MAPAAKRRKRTIVDDSDDDAQDEKKQTNQNNQNTLKRFLIASPVANKSTKPDDDDLLEVIPESSSPVRPATRSTRASAKSQPPATSSSTLQNRLPKAAPRSPSASPIKSRTRAQKKLKTEENGKHADLKALFSKQAERSQASAASGVSSKDISDFLEDIISESDDDIALSKTAASSFVGLQAHKRFRDNSQDTSQGSSVVSTQASTLSSTTGQRFLKPSRPARLAVAPALPTDDDSRPWSERFAPTNLEELAVHKRKVGDVRKWLEDVIAGRMRQRLLVLKGAAGTGKTITLKLLAEDMRCDVLEWRNPASSYGDPQGWQSASSQFEEFLGRGGKFGQLDLEGGDSPPPAPAPTTNTSKQGRRLILIEEFPNTFVRSSTALTNFRNTILEFLAANTPALTNFGQATPAHSIVPIVMVISETLLTTTSASADSFTAHRLLGPEVLRHPGTGVIEFNPIAPSLLAKALELVVKKEARRSGRRMTPGPLVLKRLGEIGDIRNAIASLEFLCVKGDDDADWGSKITFTKTRKGSKDAALTKGEQESLELISQREATLGIFHAVGKVVYNKRDEKPFPPGSEGAKAETLPDYMSHLSRPKKSEVAVDTLIDELGTDTQTFIAALHENYALSCESSPLDPNSSLDYMNGCLDYLSEADLLSPSFDIFFGGRGAFASGNYSGKDSGSHILRQDEMAFQVAVRGLLFSLPSPVKRQTHPTSGRGGGGDAFKMFYPAYLKLWRAKEELEGCVDMWATKMLKGEDGTTLLQSSGGATMSLTSGASVFQRPSSTAIPSNNNMSSWTAATQRPPQSTRQQEQITAPSSSSAPPPLLSLGSSARQEMVLERLPYMAHIARGRRCSFGSMRIRDLDKIVSFQGIGPPGTEELDEDEAAGGAEEAGLTESWATDKPVEEAASRAGRNKRGLGVILSRAAAASRGHGAAGQGQEATAELGGIQSLVLSDDDIEDDD
ncbi:Rad17 cell cycle checkpoint protein-domain-containing protein [Pseudoneurospora amorphoporcata]|uniref:Rad17 cell cycle checkpoint protein-domain-containing protein n=1 Tax=Pseudoneurospora amorphoporcata TaxID=241081 RepID=A0AAN6NL16_9PEZI|nr:Rad17 cell cycle checkpoint protein-domain-containing protein [Pseudoneurospora amorphoporcata]